MFCRQIPSFTSISCKHRAGNHGRRRLQRFNRLCKVSCRIPSHTWNIITRVSSYSHIVLYGTIIHTQSHTTTHTGSLWIQNIPFSSSSGTSPNRGVCILFIGPSLEYGCFISISLVLVEPLSSLHYIVLPPLLWNAEDCDLNGFWVLLIHRRHISHTKVAPKGRVNSTEQRGSLKSQASFKYHWGDLWMEWFWLVCIDGPWFSVMASGGWK